MKRLASSLSKQHLRLLVVLKWLWWDLKVGEECQVVFSVWLFTYSVIYELPLHGAKKSAIQALYNCILKDPAFYGDY